MTTKFDAAELGLLEKHDFKVITKDFAERNTDGDYVNIKKINDTLFYLTIDTPDETLITDHKTLRGLMKTL